MSWRRWLAAALAPLLLAGGPAPAACRLALALGLDVSGSVDMWEYRLQLDGLAAALMDPQVQAGFLYAPEVPVRVMIFEWSTTTHQRQVIGWREIRTAADLAVIAATLRAKGPTPAPQPFTGLGSAMAYGAAELRRQTGCWRLTLDISGDGPANIGRPPAEIGPEEIGPVVINGLVIGPDSPANSHKNRANLRTLREYYAADVLRGPGAFVETAQDYADFARAMRRKLIREVQPAAVSLAPAPAPDRQGPGRRRQLQ